MKNNRRNFIRQISTNLRLVTLSLPKGYRSLIAKKNPGMRKVTDAKNTTHTLHTVLKEYLTANSPVTPGRL